MTKEDKILLYELRQEKAKRLARIDFWAFCLYVNFSFFSKRPVLKLVADAFQRLYEHYSVGKVYRLSVSISPRVGKSYITTLFSVWMLGKFPRESVMRNCCTADLRDKFSRDARNIIVESKEYKEVFPKIVLREDSQALKGWTIKDSKQGSYFGAGVDGSIIGYGASMLAITDDLFKSFFDANSDKINSRTWEWKEGTHDSRLEGNCCSIDIGTRWCKDDVIGRLQDRGNYYNEIIRIPALDSEGNSTCPDVLTTEQYVYMKENTADIIWAAEYMQEPIDAQGLLYKPFQTYSDLPAWVKNNNYTDTADNGSDYLCSICYTVDMAGDIYVTDVVYTDESMETTESYVVNMLKRNSTKHAYIESNNGGRGFARAVQKSVPTTIEWFHQSGNKKSRVISNQTTVERRIFMPEGWHIRFPLFYNHVSSFKKDFNANKHDDVADALTGIIEKEVYKEGIKKKISVRRRN